MRILALILFVAAFFSAPTHAAEALFGRTETRHDSLRVFVKWTGMWMREAEQQSDQYPQSCPPKPLRPCGPGVLEQLMQDLPEEQGLAQLQAVNMNFNRAPYITDPINWGVPDFWATVYEFLSRDGDCEDYAIAKYIALKRLGVPASDMRIVVVDDVNLGVPHAVLMVEQDGERYILDNQINTVLPDTAIHHYRPIYSINEEAWWLHAQPF